MTDRSGQVHADVSLYHVRLVPGEKTQPESGHSLQQLGVMSAIYLINPDEGGIVHDGGSLNTFIDGPMKACYGVLSEGYFVARDSKVSIRGNSQNSMIGIQTTDELEVENSNVGIALTSDSGVSNIGIRSFGATFDESKPNTLIQITTDGGTALMVGTQTGEQEEPKFDPEYIPVVTKVSSDTKIISPKEALISVAGLYDAEREGYRLIETVYESSGQVASDVVIGNSKTDPEITPPTAKCDLVYTGYPQELVDAGSVTIGEMQYALGTDAATAPTEGWSASIPTGTAVGTYYVWYKVVSDKNGSVPKSV